MIRADARALSWCWLMVLLAPTAFAEVIARCDPGLVGRESGPRAYKLRDNRCEGIYAQPVNADLLMLRSLTLDRIAFDASTHDVVELTWTDPVAHADGSAGRVALRAVSLTPDLRYRMDTEVAGETVFTWPLDMVGDLNVLPKDVGLLAWMDDAGTRIYLPVRMSAAAAAAPQTLTAILIANRRVETLFVELLPGARVGVDPSVAPIWSETTEAFALFAQQPFDINVPVGGLSAGVYRLVVAARLEGGDAGTIEVPFRWGAP